jgi:hypothetical protein
MDVDELTRLRCSLATLIMLQQATCPLFAHRADFSALPTSPPVMTRERFGDHKYRIDACDWEPIDKLSILLHLFFGKERP